MLLAEFTVALPDIGIPPWVTTFLVALVGWLIRHYFPTVPWGPPKPDPVPVPAPAPAQPNMDQLLELLRQLLHARPPESPSGQNPFAPKGSP